jgi:ABC-2 type transport system ATP-binding protein
VLELHELTKRYGETVALDDLSFAVEAGQMFGFVGPNGAGKTTTMRIVIGVLEADSGEVRWRGAPIDAATRRRSGYMPEERGLYPKMRIAEQLAYLAELHGLEAQRAKRNTADWLERLGLADRADDKVEELSLGNQQRVQLAAALVHEPDLLILDEPFSGLDPVGVDVLSDALLEVVRERGVPVVFSSHQLDLVERLCDAVAIVSQGRLVAAGPVEQLRDERAGNRWRVEVLDADDGWWSSVDGARPLSDQVFELDAGVRPTALLDAARTAGEVVRFGPQKPSLADLFRDAVSERNGGGEAAR